MSGFTREGLEVQGFKGFITFDQLTRIKPPRSSGIYVVIRVSQDQPSFLEQSRGGHFKGRDPTVTLEELRQKWVNQAPVVYIGKATSLRKRLSQYRRYGIGHDVGHQGGRYIWQCEDCYEYLVAWKRQRDRVKRRGKLISEFVKVYGRRPFANLTD